MQNVIILSALLFIELENGAIDEEQIGNEELKDIQGIPINALTDWINHTHVHTRFFGHIKAAILRLKLLRSMITKNQETL